MKAMRILIGLLVTALALALALPGPAAAKEAEATYKVKYGPSETPIKVKKWRADRWTAQAGDDKYALDREGDVFKFTRPDGTKIKAKMSDDKLKLKQDDEAIIQIKYYSDKLKVDVRGDDSFEWEIKFKGDKIKVDRLESEMGQVRYDADKDKLKAKSAAGADEAALKEFGRLSAALAPFLMGESVPLERRIFLMLLFFMTER